MNFNRDWSPALRFDPLQQAARKFDQLQAEILGAARAWAEDEVGAVMAHQVNDPLTALLLYLQQMVETHERIGSASGAPASLRQIAVRALREAERLCEMMRRTERPAPPPSPDSVDAAQGRTSAWPPVHRHSLLDILTPREREVLGLITRGAANKEGAAQLGISKRTFEVHRAHIMEKLKAKNAADLVRMTLGEMR